MRRKTQLLLLGLSLVLIPWLGLHAAYLLESSLYRAEGLTLQSIARTVAAGIGERMDTAGLAYNSALPAPPGVGEPLYVPRLAYRPVLDGYADDWRGLGRSPQKFDGATASLDLWLGEYEASLYMFARIRTPQLHAHNPRTGMLASGDYLSLQWLGDDRSRQEYVLRSGAPGDVVAYYRDAMGVVRAEPSIRGVWQRQSDGFQLELQLPVSMPDGRLAVAAVLQDDSGSVQRIGNLDGGATPPALVRMQPQWERLLSGHGGSGVRLSVVDRNGWLLASGGVIQPVARQRVHPLASLLRVYRRLLGGQDARWRDHVDSGRLASAELNQVLQQRSALSWYRARSQRITRIVLPLLAGDSGRIAGAVVAERGEAGLALLAQQAAGQLLGLALLVALIPGGLLGVFVGSQSVRLRHLAQATDSALDRRGQVRARLPGTAIDDEIGHLAQRVAQLLQRVESQNLYHRNLSGKLSHELRTPLAIIRSSLDNLELDDGVESRAVYLRRARDGLERMTGILSAMSAASRVEETVANAPREYLPLAPLLQELAAAYRQVHGGRIIELSLQAEDSMVFGNADLLVQMLDKLVENAVSFSPVDAVIEIGLRRGSRGLELSVANPGPPLPDLPAEQLLQALVSARSVQQQGNAVHLGLGLYIVHLIAGFHGASVVLANRADQSGVMATLIFDGDKRGQSHDSDPFYR